MIRGGGVTLHTPQVADCSSGHGGVHDGAGRAGEGDVGLAVQFGGDAVLGGGGALFGDADQQQGEPEDEHVCWRGCCVRGDGIPGAAAPRH